ncbi:ATP-binding cassette domain-containing protein [Dechloromonas sp. TW-R-39-2]|uniref:ATP-binding cassette domain-containing protein n=1 Tax=Dechloromonas sp. TW-R-39-2 TaxID=2654218 RepID=UPI0027384CEB|nr:ATP-binding cassette domain-containing protein [Dechloromonas sp. TW-R-39-2]
MAHQDILWLLGSLCSLYRIPFDPKLVEQDCPPPHNLATFHEAARAIGFKTGQSTHPADWQKLPLPAIAFLRAVPETPSKDAVLTIPVLILKVDATKQAPLGGGRTIAFISFLVAPVFRDNLNHQLMLGARNQSFLTEYVSGMATVKSLQMEADIDKKYGDFLAQYLAASFCTKQVGNTYNVISNGLEQVMTLAILIVGALLVMQNDGFTVGMLVAFQMFAGHVSDPFGLHASFENVIQACKAAEIHQVIETLKDGYQTEIGERGTGLSGGQRQRIAIARALLKRPKILVFDEAVSNLDQQTAEHFARTINKLKGKVTMLFITHQIPRGLQVDEVIELGTNTTRQMKVVEEEK